MFHRIYEAMALGMHPANLYPRRSRVAPEARTRSELDQRMQSAVQAAIEATEARMHADAERQSRTDIDAAVAAARRDVRSTHLAASERLLDAVRAIDRARTLSEILDTL